MEDTERWASRIINELFGEKESLGRKSDFAALTNAEESKTSHFENSLDLNAPTPSEDSITGSSLALKTSLEVSDDNAHRKFSFQLPETNSDIKIYSSETNENDANVENATSGNDTKSHFQLLAKEKCVETSSDKAATTESFDATDFAATELIQYGDFLTSDSKVNGESKELMPGNKIKSTSAVHGVTSGTNTSEDNEVEESKYKNKKDFPSAPTSKASLEDLKVTDDEVGLVGFDNFQKHPRRNREKGVKRANSLSDLNHLLFCKKFVKEAKRFRLNDDDERSIVNEVSNAEGVNDDIELDFLVTKNKDGAEDAGISKQESGEPKNPVKASKKISGAVHQNNKNVHRNGVDYVGLNTQRNEVFTAVYWTFCATLELRLVKPLAELFAESLDFVIFAFFLFICTVFHIFQQICSIQSSEQIPCIAFRKTKTNILTRNEFPALGTKSSDIEYKNESGLKEKESELLEELESFKVLETEDIADLGTNSGTIARILGPPNEKGGKDLEFLNLQLPPEQHQAIVETHEDCLVDIQLQSHIENGQQDEITHSFLNDESDFDTEIIASSKKLHFARHDAERIAENTYWDVSCNFLDMPMNVEKGQLIQTDSNKEIYRAFSFRPTLNSTKVDCANFKVEALKGSPNDNLVPDVSTPIKTKAYSISLLENNNCNNSSLRVNVSSFSSRSELEFRTTCPSLDGSLNLLHNWSSLNEFPLCNSLPTLDSSKNYCNEKMTSDVEHKSIYSCPLLYHDSEDCCDGNYGKSDVERGTNYSPASLVDSEEFDKKYMVPVVEFPCNCSLSQLDDSENCCDEEWNKTDVGRRSSYPLSDSSNCWGEKCRKSDVEHRSSYSLPDPNNCLGEKRRSRSKSLTSPDFSENYRREKWSKSDNVIKAPKTIEPAAKNKEVLISTSPKPQDTQIDTLRKKRKYVKIPKNGNCPSPDIEVKDRSSYVSNILATGDTRQQDNVLKNPLLESKCILPSGAAESETFPDNGFDSLAGSEMSFDEAKKRQRRKSNSSLIRRMSLILNNWKNVPVMPCMPKKRGKKKYKKSIHVTKQ